MSIRDRNIVLEEYRSGKVKVIVNFNLLTTGFDVPGTNIIVITRPTSSLVTFSQIVGRALRGPKVGGAEYSKIYNCQDWEIGNDEKHIYEFFSDYWI